MGAQPGAGGPSDSRARSVVLNVPHLMRTEQVLTAVMNMKPRARICRAMATAAIGVCDGRGRPGRGVARRRAAGSRRRAARAPAGCIMSRSARPTTTQYDAWARRLNELGVPQQRRDRSLLFPQSLFPRTERHPVRDRDRRAWLRDRRAAGQARRKAGAAAVSRTAPRGNRSRAEAARVKNAAASRPRLAAQMLRHQHRIRAVHGLGAIGHRAFERAACTEMFSAKNRASVT